MDIGMATRNDRTRSLGGDVWRRTAITLGVLVALFGLGIRIWSLGRQAINADQAVVALMAQQILHGHFSAFYWGQNYGGGEPYVVAVVFAIFGQSTLTLGMTPILLDLVAAVLVWRIGRRLFGPTVGIQAALLFWVWPEVYIWQSTLEYGFRWFVLDLGLLTWLLALRLIAGEARHRNVELVLLGLSLGAGWWGSPEIIYFVIPLVLFIIYSLVEHTFRLSLGDVAIILVAAVIGAGAWIEANLRNHFNSLHSGVQPNPGMVHHLKIFVQHTLPMLLGVQLRISGRWFAGAIFGNVVEYLAISLGVLMLVVLVRRREALLLVVFWVLAPFIFAFSPFTWYWADGRYAVYLAPVFALLVVAGRRELFSLPFAKLVFPRNGNVARGVIAVVIGIGFTLGAMSQLAPYHPNGVVQTGSESWTSWTANPDAGFAGVANALATQGVHDVYAGYWVAYPLMFESKGKVIASDISYVRSPTILRTLEDDRRTGWLFMEPAHYRLAVAYTGVSLMDPSCAGKIDRCLLEPELVRYLKAQHIGFRTVDATPFVAIVPDRPISPAAITKTYKLRQVFSLGHSSS